MGCGTSLSDSQIKQSTSPKKPSLVQFIPQSHTTIKVDPIKQQDPKIEKKELKQKQVQKQKQKQNKQQKQNQQQKQSEQSIEEDIKLQLESKIEENIKTEESTVSMVYQSQPPIKEGKIFLFGQSGEERKIVSFDLQELKFQVVASRSRKVESNPKYQPTDVIFEQSQQLQASHLYNKFSHPPYNFMFATYLSDDKIFLCGGINADFQYISDESFIYQVRGADKSTLSSTSIPKTNLLGLKFNKLQYMNHKRYSHMGVYFPMGKLSYVYVFGGRGDDDDTLSVCQKYSIYEKKWIEIAPMKTPRSTGFSLIFKTKIYVFGGYTSEKKRTKKIEVYDPIKNYWEVLDVKLHRGIEAGIIFSVKPNEILIMGGNMELGTLKSVIKVNLAQKTYQWDSNMKNDRFLQKGGKFNDQIFVFGGDFQDTLQRYTLKDRKWRDQQVSYKQFISPDDINSFTLASETIDVKFDESHLSKTEPVNDFQRTHIFGNDQFPCILEINLSKWVLRKKAVPMALRLRCQMTVIKVKQGKYLIMGGIDSFNQKCSRAAYLYYAGTNKAIQVEKMNHKKYEMAHAVYGDNAYIFGGRSSFNGEILSGCQKFDLVEQKWKPLQNLSRQRTKAKTLVYKDQIFIWGGCDSLQNLTEIEILNPKTEEFTTFAKSLPISSQIKGILPSPEPEQGQIIIFSYNDLLNEEYCHACCLSEQEKDHTNKQSHMQESVLICSNDLKLREIKVKLPSFNCIFKFGENFNLITSKGIQVWNYRKNEETYTLKPQIIINQVEMLQFPIDKFSFSEF